MYDSLKKHNIKIRTYRPPSNIDNVDLYDLYVRQGLSINEISKRTKSNRKTISDRLKEQNIPIRSLSQSQMVYNTGSVVEALNINKKLENKEWLKQEYIDNKRSSVEIAEELNCDYSTVIRWLEKFDIPIRNNSECKIGVMTGENHPNWQGGITELHLLCREYFHVNIQPKIAERDNYTCQLCGKQHCILHVHHIYPFKDILQDIYDKHPELDPIKDKYKLYNIIVNDEMFNSYSNLITLCKECHYFKVHKYTRRQSAANS